VVIENQTGRELPKPDLYVPHAVDGHRTKGRVLNPAPIPDRSAATFDVQFPRLDGPRNIGAVSLLRGSDNYELFSPA